MAEQSGMTREEGLLFLLRRDGMKAGRPFRGRYAAVDLDRGSMLGAVLNDEGGLKPPAETETWQGEGLLPGLLQSIKALLDMNDEEAIAFLTDPDAMRACQDDAYNAEILNAGDMICLRHGGSQATYEQATAATASLCGAIQALAERVRAFWDGQEAEGSLIFYGVSAGFAPLQYAIRRAVRKGDELYEVFMPDPLFRFVPDDGAMARKGEALLRDAAFHDVSLRAFVLGENGAGPKDTVLVDKNRQGDSPLPKTDAFYAAPDASICLVVDGRERWTPIPGDFLGEGGMITAEAVKENGKISVLLRKDGEEACCTIAVEEDEAHE